METLPEMTATMLDRTGGPGRAAVRGAAEDLFRRIWCSARLICGGRVPA
jgi:hypothetical protein